MIRPNTILHFGFIVLIIFLLAKSLIKYLKESKIRKQINTKPVYSRPSVEVEMMQRKELERLIREEFNNYFNLLFTNKDFINKNTTSLDQFIINEEINEYDLHKLAQLNGIKVEMGAGWTNLVLRLIMELNEKGWNRKVSSIKEKFGELRFYASTDCDDIIDKYTEESKTICEICGQPGFFTLNITRCDEHRNAL